MKKLEFSCSDDIENQKHCYLLLISMRAWFQASRAGSELRIHYVIRVRVRATSALVTHFYLLLSSLYTAECGIRITEYILM